MSAKLIDKITPEEEKRAMELHKKAVVIEGLSYIPTLTQPEFLEYLKVVREAGVTATHITVTTNYGGLRGALSTLSGWYKIAEKADFRFVSSTNDIIQAKREGKACVIMGSQHGNILEDDLSLVRIFHRLGLRIIQLAYAEQNYIGSGGEDVDGGVSMFGRKVIDEMNRVGVLVDVSHCGDKTVMDAIRYSGKPVAITHANPRKLIKHHRNKTDEQIIALAEKGGVIGLTAWTPISTVKKGVRPTLEDFMDFIDYVVKLVGADHVGFGLDLSPFWDPTDYERFVSEYPTLAPAKFEDRLVEGLGDISKVRNITRGLVVRGYSDEDILKILGGNYLELFRKVWEV